MIHRTVEDYAAAQKDLCVQNDFIPNSLFQEYGVNRGLRDINGVGVLTGLTNISKIKSFQNVNGKREPCEGRLWYRGYDIKQLIGNLGPHEFGFEKIAYLLLFGDLPTPEQQAEVCNVVRFAVNRSMYSREHLDYVIAAVKALYEDRENIPNMRIVQGRDLPMRHFHAFLEPYPNE